MFSLDYKTKILSVYGEKIDFKIIGYSITKYKKNAKRKTRNEIKLLRIIHFILTGKFA